MTTRLILLAVPTGLRGHAPSTTLAILRGASQSYTGAGTQDLRRTVVDHGGPSCASYDIYTRTSVDLGDTGPVRALASGVPGTSAMAAIVELAFRTEAAFVFAAGRMTVVS